MNEILPAWRKEQKSGMYCNKIFSKDDQFEEQEESDYTKINLKNLSLLDGQPNRRPS
jgi:hypothetical protein